MFAEGAESSGGRITQVMLLNTIAELAFGSDGEMFVWAI